MWNNFIGKIAVDETICPVKATHSCSAPYSPYKLPFCNLQTSKATKREWQLKKGCSFQSDSRYETTLSAGKWESKYPWTDNRLATCHNYSLNGWRFDVEKGHWEIFSTPSPNCCTVCPRLLTSDARDFLRSWRDSLYAFMSRCSGSDTILKGLPVVNDRYTVICSVSTVLKNLT